MSIYHKILITVDLSANSSLVIQRAQAIAASSASITLLHVVEYIPVEPLGEMVIPTMRMDTELVNRATDKLSALASQHGLVCEQRVVVGNTKTEIQYVAQQIGADLLVVGNNERHGLSALLNFTEDTVLHTAPCDVLAVHLPEPATS
ncbi:MAG: universal stress protein [Steroidobacteraceae bacterium]